ncbi:MAG TPA: cupin domain-containing protein [Gaiellaceae bacterium]|nr:cupin domain-containing protein [Gaiellaceae bacterium]
MSEPVLVPPGGGEVVGDSLDRRVEILSDHETLNATWSRFGPHREGADLHVHREHTDLFYVLAGELTVRLGLVDDAVVVPAGTLVRVPPLVVHGFRNGSDAEVRYLNFHAPGRRFADFLRAARDGRSFAYDQHPPPPVGGRPVTEVAIGGSLATTESDGRLVTLLADVEEIAVAETSWASGSASPAPHARQEHVVSLYVLEGELTLVAGGGERRAEAGTWVQVPPGVPHALAPPAGGDVRLLEIHTPGSGFGASPTS